MERKQGIYSQVNQGELKQGSGSFSPPAYQDQGPASWQSAPPGTVPAGWSQPTIGPGPIYPPAPRKLTTLPPLRGRLGAGPKLELLEEGDQVEASYLGSTFAAPPGDQDGHQKTVVVSQQPQAQAVVQITGSLTPNNCCLIVLSVFACVLCCCPVGPVAMILAIVARNKWASGDHPGGQSLNMGALGVLVASVVCGIVFYLVICLFYYLQ